MTNGPGIAAITFGLASAATWGIGDFCGGFATRRVPAMVVTLLSQIVGVALLIFLAVLYSENFPSTRDIFWGGAAGIAGMVGLMSLYRAMAIGQVGIAAPISAVLSATLPVIVGAMTQGLPTSIQLLGFFLALISIWIISNPQGSQGRPAGLNLAILSGLGLGGFLILIAQVQPNAIFWPLVIARLASISLLLILTITGKKFTLAVKNSLLPIILTGALDAGGNAFFVLSEQAGRLDIAGILSSLYPVTTVILAFIILKERMTKFQSLGVLLALIAVPLIAS